MTELKNNLQPLLTLVAKEILPPSPGVDYLKAKYQLILKYGFLTFSSFSP